MIEMSSKNDTTDGGVAADGPTDGPAVVPDNSTDVQSSGRLGRRTFLKGIGATAAAGIGTKYVGSPVGDAAAVVPLVPIGIGLAGLGAGAYLGEKIGDFIGDDRDLGGYTGDQALVEETREKVLTVQSTTEQVLNSMRNIGSSSKNVALPKAMKTVVEQLDAGATESEAVGEMELVVNKYYSDVMRDVITNYQSIVSQIHHVAAMLDRHDTLGPLSAGSSPAAVNKTYDGSIQFLDLGDLANFWLGTGTNWSVTTHTLPDGSTVDIDVFDDGGTYGQYSPLMTDHTDGPLLFLIDKNDLAASGSSLDGFYQFPDSFNHALLMDDLERYRSDVISEVSTLVADTYAAYQAGEVDLSDYLDPVTAYSEFGTDADGYENFAGAAASMMGVPRTDEGMTMTLNGDREVTGTIYSSQAPTNGFTVGEWYDTANLSYPVFLSYSAAVEDENGDLVEQTGFTQLDGTFRIDSAKDADGNEKTAVNTKEGITYDTADISDLEQQLQQVRTEQEQLLAESNTGGGGGWSGMSTTDKGIVAGVAAVILAAVTR